MGLVGIFNVADFTDPNDDQKRTYREVNNAMSHTFSVGDLVEVYDGVRLFIAKQSRDCDGTPLYCLTPEKDDYHQDQPDFYNSNWINGFCESSMKLIKEKES